MTEDWAAVAKAINERSTERGLNQRELAEQSRVSLAIVRELQRNTVQRRRSRRTLEALSIALGWHPGHLAAVLAGRRPLGADGPADAGGDDLPGRLGAIEQRLGDIVDQLADLNANLETVIARAWPDRR